MWLDGREWSGGTVPEGLHLVQAGGRRGPPTVTRMVRVAAGTPTRIDAGELAVEREPNHARPGPELVVLAGGALYGRFALAGYGGLTSVFSMPLTGRLRGAAGVHVLLGEHAEVGIRALPVARAGVELGFSQGQAVRVGLLGLLAPQDHGTTVGPAVTGAVTTHVRSALVRAEGMVAWCGAPLVHGGVGLGRAW